jgi:hypothetical protein
MLPVDDGMMRRRGTQVDGCMPDAFRICKIIPTSLASRVVIHRSLQSSVAIFHSYIRIREIGGNGGGAAGSKQKA